MSLMLEFVARCEKRHSIAIAIVLPSVVFSKVTASKPGLLAAGNNISLYMVVAGTSLLTIEFRKCGIKSFGWCTISQTFGLLTS
jgi:hypothetical protein